ncbi:MAG: DNA repair protein RadC [Nitriliruptorales bacterium]|nr:DNA repair protein RadC [Nitriliruptorales bacterium]
MSVTEIPMSAWSTGPVSGHSRRHRGRLCTGCVDALVEDIDERPAITSPEAAADLVIPMLDGLDRERCVALLLDTKHRLLEMATVSIGSIDHTFMSPREVFRDALLANASAVVLAHNHPSGDPQPSRDDEAITRRLVSSGELLGVTVLDHLVTGGTRWVSLARRGVC